MQQAAHGQRTEEEGFYADSGRVPGRDLLRAGLPEEGCSYLSTASDVLQGSSGHQ